MTTIPPQAPEARQATWKAEPKSQAEEAELDLRREISEKLSVILRGSIWGNRYDNDGKHRTIEFMPRTITSLENFMNAGVLMLDQDGIMAEFLGVSLDNLMAAKSKVGRRAGEMGLVDSMILELGVTLQKHPLIPNEADVECLKYVLEKEAGSSNKRFQDGLRDCDSQGFVFSDRQVSLADGTTRGKTLFHFCEDAKKLSRDITPGHVAALRLYSTTTYQTLNSGLRTLAWPHGEASQTSSVRGCHPYPCTMMLLNQGIKLLMAVPGVDDFVV